jgi:hypothetical protein
MVSCQLIARVVSRNWAIDPPGNVPATPGILIDKHVAYQRES